MVSFIQPKIGTRIRFITHIFLYFTKIQEIRWYITLDGVLKNFFLPPLIIDAFDPPDHKYSFDFALGGLWNVQIQKNEK